MERLDELIAARKAAGLTQVQLAVACGMSVSQIAGLERGRIDILNTTVGNLFALSDALGVEPQTLVGRRRKAKRRTAE